MTQRSTKLEAAANIAILVSSLISACLLAAFLLRGTPSKVRSPSEERFLQVGDKLPVQGLKLAPGKYTYIFALQVGCRFCAQSAPEIRAISTALRNRSRTATMAIFPVNRPGGEAAYLKSLSLSLPYEIAPFESLKIRGTPTTIQCDDTGRVMHIWNGALTPSEQDEIINQSKL